ncbi:MAG: HAMP domain-containing histidine kinase [Clostridiales bacterium]|nr:HAMP domain-containing histidine kinase [Clostridiales bacterium]
MTELKSLRMKFVLYHMLTVTAVIGLAVTVGLTVLRQNLSEESSKVLARAAAGEFSEQIFDVTPYVRIPYFALTVDSGGEVIVMDGSYNSFPEENFLETVALLGVSSLSEEGILPDYHLRYLRLSTPGGYVLAFTDTSYEDSVWANLTRNLLLIGAAMWVGLFVMSWFFARWAVRPVEESIQKQKQFVADASHELKTPLTVIHANAELIAGQARGISPDIDKWLGNLDQECREMRHLIEELILLARNERIGSAVHKEKLDFSELVTESVLEFEPVFFQNGREIDCEIRENIAVRGDREQLHSLVKILLDNAVKYSAPGSRTKLTLEATGRRRVCLSVTTPGTPLSRQECKDVFRRFYRAEETRRTKEGCGLGLSIAAGIARSHHARIEADTVSELGNEANVFQVIFRGKISDIPLGE